jgi:formylglycine-generating enzyme required for sulfatase activity
MAAKTFIAMGLIAGCASVPSKADTFGSGANTFTIDFVNVGNPGNGNDAGAGGGSYSSPYGGVAYSYRMGVTEVAQDWITKANNLGLPNFFLAGSWSGDQPASNMKWNEAAAFVNWLNTTTGHQAAYNLTFSGGSYTMGLWSAAQAWDNDPGAGQELNLFRHKDAYYFLPSEDEWYKAAYHKNDGVTANYWDYATQTNTPPTAVASGTGAGTAVYGQTNPPPSGVGISGGLSGYGTRGQNGNIQEWLESAGDGVNDSPLEDRVQRGGNYLDLEDSLRSSVSNAFAIPQVSDSGLGFRVASVPEPSTAIVILTSGFAGLLARRRRMWRE